MSTKRPEPAKPEKARMKWTYFKSKLLMKYALSYILTFLIPLTGVTAFVYNSAVNGLRSEIEQSNVNQLIQVRSNIDARINELYSIAGRITYDEHLTPYLLHHPYHSRDAIQTLGNYRASNGIIEDLLLYMHGDDVIYSYRGMTDLEVVFNKYYHFEKWTGEQWISHLQEAKQPIVRPAENVTVYSRTEPMLSLLIPIKPNDPYPYGAVLYLMKESKLTGVMDSVLGDFSGGSYIFDGSGQALTSNSRGLALKAEELATLASLEPGIHRLTLDGESHSAVSVQSEENDWTYVTTMPSQQFFGRVAHVQTLILVVFAITVVTGIIAAMLLAKRQYHPIKDLVELAAGRSGGGDPAKAENEWDSIRETLHAYSRRIDMQKPYVRNQCLLLLLKRGKPDDPEIGRMIAGIGLEIPEGRGRYFSAVLSWEPAAGGQELEERRFSAGRRQALQDLLGNLELPELGARVYGLDYSAEDRIALVFAYASDGSGEEEAAEATAEMAHSRAGRIVEAVCRAVASAPGSFHMGVGSVYGDLSQLNQSFIEAATALEHHRMSGRGRVSYFEQMSGLTPPEAETMWIPKKTMLKLEQSLKQGNGSVALSIISDTVETLKRETPPLPLLRCICFDLLNALLRTASELGMNEAFAEIGELASFETLEQMEANLIGLTGEICRQVERNTEDGRSSLIDDIVRYVDEQYADYMLSLEHVALKYSVSTSYLSRAFKERTGCNFSQYIWQLRVGEVIRLLETTSAPLKEIIERVGYLDAANFIRKFKRETGVTPGQYRKQNMIKGTVPKGKTARS